MSALKLCAILAALIGLFVSNVENVAQQETVQVPNLIGLRLTQASDVLEKAGLRVGKVTEKLSKRSEGVIEQDPSPGKIVMAGTRVDLLVSVYPAVPQPSPAPPPSPPPVFSPPPRTGAPPPPGPNGKLPHSPSVPPSVFSEVDNILSTLPLGRIVFNVPGTMRLGESHDIKLLLSASKSLEELKKELPGKIESAELRIAEKMQARLTGQDFAISAVKPEIQAISGHENTEWEWEVRATSGGNHSLHLTIDAILLLNNVETPRTITTFDRKIAVQVTFGQHVAGFITRNWEWLWTTVLIPVAAWLWRWRGKKHGPVA